MKLRLQKHIRDVTGISRRNAEELIKQGKVYVNGKLALLGQVVDTDSDIVKIDKKPLETTKEHLYIMLNKPAGYLTTRNDPQHRKTVYSLLPSELSFVFPVGRLDLDTQGLLLLTNDGDFSYRLTHPKFEVPKEYEVEINGQIKKEEIEEIKVGIKSEIINTSPAQVIILNQTDKFTRLRLIIHEGQNREIKRIFEVFGYKVMQLKRTRFKELSLGKLELGHWRFLTPNELSDL